MFKLPDGIQVMEQCPCRLNSLRQLELNMVNNLFLVFNNYAAKLETAAENLQVYGVRCGLRFLRCILGIDLPDRSRRKATRRRDIQS